MAKCSTVKQLVTHDACTMATDHANQHMHDLDVELVQAVDLTKLDLSHNRIKQLPQQLWELHALVTLLVRYGWHSHRALGAGIEQCKVDRHEAHCAACKHAPLLCMP